MEPKYLRHMGNGRIFGYTNILAQRPDMLPYDGDLPDQKPGEAEVKPDIGPDETDPNRIMLILDAIDSLDPDTGFTKGGLPDAKQLSKILGDIITSAERDEAWAMKNKGNV